jgi:hypothetical protein
MAGAGISEIARRLCALLDEQIKVISGRGFQDLTETEWANYELRREQIAALRAKLDALANPN